MIALRKKLLFLAVMLLLLGAGLLLVRFTHTPFPWEASNAADQSERPPSNSLEIREEEADKTVWAKEMLAQRCGRTFESLWDAVNAATNKLSLLAAFPVNEILLGSWGAPHLLPHGIELRQPTGPGRTLSAGEWRLGVEKFAHEGWQLDNLEFRHVRFDTDNSGLPSQSHFYFAARLTNPATTERAVVDGDLVVD